MAHPTLPKDQVQVRAPAIVKTNGPTSRYALPQLRKRAKENELRRRTIAFSARDSALDKEKRTLRISFSSETREVMTYNFESGGLVPEILSHETGAMDAAPLTDAGSVLLFHDPAKPVAIPERVELDADGRRGVALIRFPPNVPASAEAWEMVDSGLIRGVSVGWEPLAYETVRAGEKSSGGHEGPAVVITRWRVHEISLTPVPADTTVGVNRQNQGREWGMNPILRMARAAGVSDAFAQDLIQRKVSEDDASELIAKERERILREDKNTEPIRQADEPDDDEPDDDEPSDDEPARAARKPRGKAAILAAELEARARERERIVEIRAAVRNANLGREIEDRLIADGVTIDEARKTILAELGRQTPRAVSLGSTPVEDGYEKRLRYWSANLGRRMRLPETDETKAVPRGHVSIPGMIREYLGHIGYPGAVDMSPAEAVMAYLSRERERYELRSQNTMYTRAGANTSADLSNLLSALQNKTVQRAFISQPATWRSWARTGSLTDFKQAPWIQLSGAGALRETQENGEILDSKLDDGAEARQLAVYARILSFSWQAMVNDDLGALERTSAQMGRKAAELPSRLIYTALMSNSGTGPTMRDANYLFDDTNHANYMTGSTTVLSETALGEAVAKFLRQTEFQAPNDTDFPADPIAVQPRVLLVSPTLQLTAQNIINPNAYVTGMTAFIAKYDLQVEPRLEHSGYSGNSTTHWYLAAAANDYDTAEVAFLNGDESPMITMFEDFDVLAMKFRVVLPCGVKFLDWRGIVRSKGAA